MKNLAGNKDCDKFIEEELKRARVPFVYVDRSSREVPSAIEGELRTEYVGVCTND